MTSTTLLHFPNPPLQLSHHFTLSPFVFVSYIHSISLLHSFFFSFSLCLGRTIDVFGFLPTTESFEFLTTLLKNLLDYTSLYTTSLSLSIRHLPKIQDEKYKIIQVRQNSNIGSLPGVTRQY